MNRGLCDKLFIERYDNIFSNKLTNGSEFSMDVNSVMSTYDMSSLWNTLNSTSINSAVPLVSNVNSHVQEEYTASNYFGQTPDEELQDIYQHVEPTYGAPLTYSRSGDLSIPANTQLPDDCLSAADSNIISLLQSADTGTASTDENILSQYDAIENGTYQYCISSILSENPYDIYNAVSSLSDTSTQSASNNLNALA